MLFLLKRTWLPELVALLALVAMGLGVRALLKTGPEFGFSVRAALLGLAVFGAVLLSDVSLHGLFCLLFGNNYRQRHRELVAIFRGQRFLAILIGSWMAGLGEELVFRGLGMSPAYLVSAAAAFGVLHHIRRDLWPFTLWAIWQGLLFAAALYVTELLCVTMVAHFLHDLTGFLLFRYFNQQKSTLHSPLLND